VEGGETLVYNLGICLELLAPAYSVSPSDHEHILMSHWHTAIFWHCLYFFIIFTAVWCSGSVQGLWRTLQCAKIFSIKPSTSY